MTGAAALKVRQWQEPTLGELWQQNNVRKLVSTLVVVSVQTMSFLTTL